jgi:pimeloyl-ACP methyl ester carboxylesterase
MRPSQILMPSALGKFLNGIIVRMGDKISKSQMGSVWARNYTEAKIKEADIKDMMDLVQYNGGHLITYKIMSYLNDRARFEPRWMTSLSKLRIPIMLMWGDDDAVSPIAMPHSVAEFIQKDLLTFKILPGIGHFLMLEQPETWATNILEYINSVKKTERTVKKKSGKKIQ